MVVIKGSKFKIQIYIFLMLTVTFALGALAIIGWVANIPSMVQLTPSSVPMQFNTALCFLCISIAAMLCIKHVDRRAVIVVFVAFILSALTLIQYGLAVNFHIDELFVIHNITTNTSHPGRMAPNTALCFLLCSTSLLLYVYQSTHRLILNGALACITFVLALGLVSILGYAFGIETTYGWGAYTQMSLQTAFGFVSFCMAWLALVAMHNRFGEKNMYQMPLISGAAIFIVTVVFANALHNQIISAANVVLIVFWFGVLISISTTLAIIFVQHTLKQTRLLLKQEQEKIKFKSDLERSHLTLKLATEVAKLGTWSWNVNTGELTWNERMFDIYETPDSVKASGLLYEYWYATVHPEDRDRAAASLQKAVSENQNWREEFRLLLKGGRIKYIKASAICVHDNTNQSIHVYGGNLDVTQEKELQQQLEQKSLQAEKSSLAKSQFLANMSHEIRTPMNGVLGIGDLLSTTNLNGKQAEYLNIMMSSANKLLSLLNDILDISKIEAGEMKLEIICIPIEEVIADTLKSLATEAHAKGLDYHFVIDKNVPKWLYTDPVRFAQILSNIVSNAIKFTEKGSILVDITGQVNSNEREGFCTILVCITDTGIGLEPTKLNSIFQPFYQADESTTRKYGGSGLGLAIVRQLIDEFNGTLDVESDLGRGTKVIFSIPMRIGQRGNIAASANDNYEYYIDNSSKALQATNCLIIDSNQINRDWLISMLHSWKCNVTACSDINEGARLVEQSLKDKRYFDVLLIEHNQKTMDANAAITRIKKICQDYQIADPATIIVMTSNGAMQNTPLFESIGINQYLVKPIKQSEVFNAITTVLGKKDIAEQTLELINRVNENEQLNVLVAEDHPVNQYLIREILEKRGHKVTIVENGRLVIEALEQEKFSAIIMDVQMPVMDGLMATQLIRAGNIQTDICIIGLTAKAFKEDRYACLDAGMNYYLSKPTNPSELIAALENPNILHDRSFAEQHSKQDDNNTKTSAVKYRMLDLDRCHLTTGGDAELLCKMLRLIRENIAPVFSQLDGLLVQQNWQELGKVIHKNKGMLANFCIAELVVQMENLIEKSEQSEIIANEIKISVDNVRDLIELLHVEIIDYLKNYDVETN